MFVRLLFAAAALPLAAAAWAAPLALEEAVAFAQRANPALRSAQAGLAALDGQLKDSRAPQFNNPQVSGGFGARRAPQAGLPDQRTREWAFGLSQTFEIAGQAGFRRGAAESELESAREGIAEVSLKLRAEVEQRYYEVLALKERIANETLAMKAIDDVTAVIRKRVAAGEDAKLEGNLAEVEASRARSQLLALREQLAQALVELGTVLQWPAAEPLEIAGDVYASATPYSLPQLLSRYERRPQFRALELKELAARNRLDLERAAAKPDVTFGVSTAREGPGDLRERVLGFSVSVPLPLFRQNAGGIGRATSELTQANIERQAAARDARAQVLGLWERHLLLSERVERLLRDSLPRLTENQRLIERSLQLGEIGIVQFLLAGRQALEGRKDLLESLAAYHANRVALEYVSGWHATPSTKPGTEK